MPGCYSGLLHTGRWAVRSPWHGSVLPIAKFKDAARVTLSWGGMGAAHDPLQPCENYRSLNLGQAYFGGMAPLQITQAERVAPIKLWKHRIQCPMRLLQHN